MLFGGTAPAALNRMAKWGKGYIAGTVPASMAASWFDSARQAWTDAGRGGQSVTAYFALGDFEKGRTNVYDYYSSRGEEIAGLTSGAVVGSTGAVRDVVKQYEDLGIDELFFNASTDDPDEIERLAEAVR